MRVGIVGAGVIGLATAHELRRAGHDVVCHDAGEPMGMRSAGDTRIFRLAHERADLVDRAREARSVWQEWSGRAGRDLVGAQQLVISGDRTAAMASAMNEADVAVELRDRLPDGLWLPGSPRTPMIIDVAAGVIDVQATGTFLRTGLDGVVVRSRVIHIVPLDDRVQLRTDAGDTTYDRVIIAAGAGCADLAAAVGVDIPTTLVRHTRYTFALTEQRASACWIDGTVAWRDGYTTYGHSAVAGQCAIGGGPPAADVAWDLGADEVARRSLDALLTHLPEAMPSVIPTPIARIDCDYTAPGGDGYSVTTRGAVTVVWGDNLFKFAPLIGRELANAAVDQAAAWPSDT